MMSLVRPELPTASVGSSQAPTAAVDNSASFATRPQSTYKSGKAVQTSGATSLRKITKKDFLETLRRIKFTAVSQWTLALKTRRRIFAQCNNFISLRLTNDADQTYVRRLFPDNANAITEILPNLAPGECVVVGDAVLLPAVIKMPLPVPEPHSQSVQVHKEWKEQWRDIVFAQVIERWRK